MKKLLKKLKKKKKLLKLVVKVLVVLKFLLELLEVVLNLWGSLGFPLALTGFVICFELALLLLEERQEDLLDPSFCSKINHKKEPSFYCNLHQKNWKLPETLGVSGFSITPTLSY